MAGPQGHLEWRSLWAPNWHCYFFTFQWHLEFKTRNGSPPRTFGMEFPMGLWAPHWHCYFSIFQLPLEFKTGKFRPPRTFGMAFPMGSPLALLFLHIPMASSHCQAECKQISMWQKGLVGQCWAGLTLNFNFHCLIQWNSRGSLNKNDRGWPEVVLVSISECVWMRKVLFNVP